MIFKRYICNNNLFKFLDYYIERNNVDIKIIRNNKCIYPRKVVLPEVSITQIQYIAKKTFSYFYNYNYDIFNLEFKALCSMPPRSFDVLYNTLYGKVDFYAFQLPNKDIIYIKKPNDNDFHDYLKFKLLYLNICDILK